MLANVLVHVQVMKQKRVYCEIKKIPQDVWLVCIQNNKIVHRHASKFTHTGAKYIKKLLRN